MKSYRRTLVSTPSEKSLSHATQDSQIDTSRGYFMPNQCNKRFTRKNTNSSQEKSKNRTTTDIDQESSLSTSRHLETSKCSKQKPLQGFVKVNPEKDVRMNQTSYDLGSSGVRTGSFKILRVRQNRLTSNLQDTIRISEQKYTSRQSNKSIDSVTSKCGTKSNNIAVLKTQLQLKEKELMVLEDERRRFRNNLEDMKRKETQLQQQLGKCEQEAKKMRESFKENIVDLEKKLEQYSAYNKKLQEQNAKLKKQHTESLKQKKILQKQLNAFITKQIPKNIRDLQSCRQISLQMTIQQLKSQLKKNKSEVQKEMEIVIMRLRQETIAFREEIKTLEIRNRLMDKKSCDSQRYLEAYTAVKEEYKSARSSLKQVTQECQLLRTQNVKLKKQIKKLHVHTINAKKPIQSQRKMGQYNSCGGHTRGMYTQQEQEQGQGLERVPSDKSLNLSLSACSK